MLLCLLLHPFISPPNFISYLFQVPKSGSVIHEARILTLKCCNQYTHSVLWKKNKNNYLFWAPLGTFTLFPWVFSFPVNLWPDVQYGTVTASISRPPSHFHLSLPPPLSISNTRHSGCSPHWPTTQFSIIKAVESTGSELGK